ncbi:unnamed protein product, partial [marine sediment metagenome]
MIDRSELLIIGLLGILKSGGAYLPIDPEYPHERVNYILKDSNPKALLIHSDFGSNIASYEGLLFEMDTQLGLLKEPDNNIDNMNRSSHLAYVIYTSGSTGTPKGVMVEHGGFINMSSDQINAFGVAESDRVLQFSSASFDASLSEIFMALLSGASLVLVDKKTLTNPPDLMRYMEEKQITVVTLTPIYMSALYGNELRGLKTIITAGEPANIESAVFYSRTKNVFNAYGPTEASVC